MILSKVHATTIAIAAAVITCFPASTKLEAATTITYTASGTFASPQVSGSDLYKLAGEPFTITITASESLTPTKSGKTYAEYTKLKMTGTVQSGLVPTPFTLSSSTTSMELAFGNKSYDVFALFAPIKVLGQTITILAKIQMPVGTITSAAIGPFKGPVTMTPATATVTYSYTSGSTTNSTTLGLNGTLTAK
jgi:hypothetical protein